MTLKPPPNTVLLENVKAPMPFMVPKAANAFNKLREIASLGSGIDFLAVCGDIMRPAGFISTKDGVANRSWHKTGRAFDYDQTSKALVIVSELIGGKQFFRTWLLCADQTGKFGVKKSLRDYRGGSANAYVFDFTAAAERVGFKRIPAWNGWQKNYNRREFWHYQFDEGLTWQAAMNQLKGVQLKASDSIDKISTAVATNGIIGLNDRGERVIKIQSALFAAGLLEHEDIDGVFGEKTLLAVKAFQARSGLDIDGLVGPATRTAIHFRRWLND